MLSDFGRDVAPTRPPRLNLTFYPYMNVTPPPDLPPDPQDKDETREAVAWLMREAER